MVEMNDRTLISVIRCDSCELMDSHHSHKDENMIEIFLFHFLYFGLLPLTSCLSVMHPDNSFY